MSNPRSTIGFDRAAAAHNSADKAAVKKIGGCYRPLDQLPQSDSSGTTTL